MGRLFGTDGVRGRANVELTPELAMSVAAAAARMLAAGDGSHAPVAVVGRDPRASGEMLEAAVIAGLTSAGASVARVGVLPTPGVAYLVGELGADLGVMLSASHNPMPDNGIKLFAAGGHKLPDDAEDAIEAALAAQWSRPDGARIGRVFDRSDEVGRYVEHVLAAVSKAAAGAGPAPLDGLTVVVDCANGAAAAVAPEVYRRAGANVIAIAAQPDGLNINDGCGSTHLDHLRGAVREHGADLGLAHDGDADRCLAVAADGELIDGDQIMGILAVAMRNAGTLTANTLVATVMSNLGLRLAMRDAGIAVLETKVGDRYVLEELRSRNLALGGEQSGHIVLPAFATTGDGVLTGLLLLNEIARAGVALAELASVVRRLPQVLVNVPVADRTIGTEADDVRTAVAAVEAELGEAGRVLLRPSGTEPLVRVMVEAQSEPAARAAAERIADCVRRVSPVA